MQKPSKKLGLQKIGLYKVTKLVKSSYQLELPESMKIYNVFYFGFLKPAAKNSLLGQLNDFPPPVVVNKEKKQKVDNIFDAKKHGKQVLYQVKQKGYNENKQ